MSVFLSGDFSHSISSSCRNHFRLLLVHFSLHMQADFGDYSEIKYPFSCYQLNLEQKENINNYKPVTYSHCPLTEVSTAASLLVLRSVLRYRHRGRVIFSLFNKRTVGDQKINLLIHFAVNSSGKCSYPIGCTR